MQTNEQQVENTADEKQPSITMNINVENAPEGVDENALVETLHAAVNNALTQFLAGVMSDKDALLSSLGGWVADAARRTEGRFNDIARDARVTAERLDMTPEETMARHIILTLEDEFITRMSLIVQHALTGEKGYGESFVQELDSFYHLFQELIALGEDGIVAAQTPRFQEILKLVALKQAEAESQVIDQALAAEGPGVGETPAANVA